MKPITGSLLLMAGMASAVADAAPACSAASGPRQTPLVELYTSEGCSSCPPADRWLSGLKRAADDGRVVPLAFHVDYWDYIGWKDRFAKAEFSRKQREAVARQGSRTVYTPQVMRNGRDERGWIGSLRFDHGGGEDARQPAARVGLERTASATGQWKVRVSGAIDDPALASGAYVHIALFENDLESAVGAGENAGARLRHDFVVRSWLGPFPVAGNGRIEHVAEIGIDPAWRPARLGLAAIAYSARGEVLQAVRVASCDPA